MSAKYAHLHVHTKFSYRDALPSPAEVVKGAKELGYEAVAITDHGNMGGHFQFAKAAKSESMKAIFGVEAYLCKDMAVQESIVVTDETGKTRKRRPKHNHIILLAENQIGYQNLLNLSKASAEEGFYYEPRIDWNVLEANSEGIICLSACLAGEVAFNILHGDQTKNAEIVDRYRQTFGDRFYLEIQSHGLDDEIKAYPEIEKLADEMKIPLVGTNDVHYVKQHPDATIHDLVVSMRFKRDQNKGGSSDARNLSSAYKFPEFYLKSPEEMISLFGHRPEISHNVLEVADRCTFQYPLGYSIIWPKCDVEITEEIINWRDKNAPEQNLVQAYLSYTAIKNLKQMGLAGSKEYRDRLIYELSNIFDLGYEDYFLTQLSIIKGCEERDIMVGPGRGSGAGSLVLYALGITQVDPLKFGLLFERFLNPGRGPQFDHSLPIEEFQEQEQQQT